MRVYTVEQKQSQTTLQANLKVVLSISCDTSSNSYSSKNTVNIDESKIQSIKIGGNFIAYLTVDGQVFAVYYNVKESTTVPVNLETANLLTRSPPPPADKPEKKKHRKRVDSLLSDLLKEYTASPSTSEEVFSSWSSPSSSPAKSEQTQTAGEPSLLPKSRTQRGTATEQSLDCTDCSDVEHNEEMSELYFSDYVQAQVGQQLKLAKKCESETQTTAETKEEPEVSQPVQWLNSRNNSLYFTMIAATKCAVLLVCSNGQLWRWDMLDNTFEEHPLYKTYCGEKAVVKISTSNLRITVLLDTGEVAVFYDNFLSGGSQPMIISQLSHPSEQPSILEKEVIVDIKSGDFISAVLTESGKIFWWGMLQKEMCLSKAKSKSGHGKSIKSGSQVVLKVKANDILIGSLVYTAYPQSKLGRVEGCAGNAVIVRLCDRTSSPSGEKPKVETWSNSQTVVLETTIVPLGTVIGLHGTNAIIMTSRHTDPLLFRTEWKQYRRMFSEGQLDKLHDEDVEMEPKKAADENIMDIDESSVASDTSHTNSAYPNLCVYPVSELEVYESGGYAHNVQKTPVDLLAAKNANFHDFAALTFSIDHIGNMTVLARCQQTGHVYMLTKDGVSEKCEAIEGQDASFLSDINKLSMLTTPDVVMVIDNHSVPFVPPLPTCLNFREFNYFPTVNAIAIKQEVSTVAGKSRLIVAMAKQPQVIMPVILQGDLKYLSHLQSAQGASEKHPAKQENTVPAWSSVVRALDTERDACGRSCLHVCAIAKPNPKKAPKRPPSMNNSLLPIRVDDSYFHSITLMKRNYSFEELRFRHYTLERQKELKEHDRWLNVMMFICGIQGLDLPRLLSLTDNAGYTPFIAAIASKNYNNAWYLLPLIMKLDKEHPGLMDRAVWKALQYNTSVNHLLAQGLLHNALIIQHIPTWCTEQTLLNLFSQNYSSIYKIIIQQKPKNMVKSVGRRLFDTTKPLTVRDRILRSFMRGPSGSTHSTSHHKYSKLQQGILFFSDPLEARKALIQMDGYVIPSKTNQQRHRTSNFLSYSNPGGFFEVSVRFVEREIRGFFLTPSKKKKTRVKEEFEQSQENSRRLLAQSLLQHYTGEVNALCETPLATLVNESLFSKLEDKKKSEKVTPFPTDPLITPHRLERGMRHTLQNELMVNELMVNRAARLSQRTSSRGVSRFQDLAVGDISDRFSSPSTSSSTQSYLAPWPFAPYFCSDRDRINIDRLLVTRRSSTPEVRGERANFSISSSDIEEEATVPRRHSDDPWAPSDRSPVPPRYFDELRDELVPNSHVFSDGRPSSGHYSTGGMYHLPFLPSEQSGGRAMSRVFDLPDLMPDTLPSDSLTYQLAYNPLTSIPVLPSNPPSSAPVLPSNPTSLPSNVLPGSTAQVPVLGSAAQMAVPVLGSAVQTEAAGASADKTEDGTLADPVDTYPERKEASSSLDCVAKQLCNNELVVMTTVYCCYSNSKKLPSDIDFMVCVEKKEEEEEEEEAEHPTKKRKLEPEEEEEETLEDPASLYSLSDIEEMIGRVNTETYHPEMTTFIHNLVGNTTNGPDVTATLLKLLKKRHRGGLFISLLFVRSLTKYLTLQLTNIGPRECLAELPEFKLISETRKLLDKFGWLSVLEILTAGEALLLPLQYNTFKSQTHTSVMDHHIFPHPPGFMFPSCTSQAISLHPSTYMRQCPLLKDRDTAPKHKRKLSLVAETQSNEEEEISGDEFTDEESSLQDDASSSFLPQINFFDVVDNFFNPNPPQITTSEEDPYLMWAVDGQTNTFRPVFRTQQSAEEMTLLRENSNERGKNILACVYSRLVKCAADIASKTSEKMCDTVKPKCEALIQDWWCWLEPVVTSMESQFVKAAEFDLEKYSAMLKQGERKIKTLYNPSNLTKSSITASFPQEYVMYLLDSHTSENNTSLPILDIKSYKHVVYIFDTMFYIVSNWPRSAQQSGPRHGSDNSAAQKPVTFLKRSPSLDFGVEAKCSSGEVLKRDLERSVEVQLPLALQPHLLTPMANRDSLFSTVTGDKKKQAGWRGKESLKQALRKKTTLLTQTPADFLSTYEKAIRVFSTYYLGEGPGIEKDSVLNLRACYSGKIARFVRQIKEMKWLVQSQNRQEMRDLPPRIYNLHIYVNRNRLLPDSLKCLLEMNQLHPVNYSVKFEGEEGGGPGVNRGWFSVVCSAIREKAKYPDKTLPLFYCPGRLPEQANTMCPQPWDNTLFVNPAVYKQRLDGFRAAGRFLGLALWFKQTLPLKLCRHVWKFLLGRKMCWGDLAFYNADLYEGLRAMLNDAKWMTEEEFVEVYPCTFEVEVNGQLQEFKPKGSEIQLTKHNVEEYIQGYSEQLMVECVMDELQALKLGFTDVVPSHILSGLTAEDLTLLLSGGNGEIPFERLYNIVTFANSIGCSQKRLEQFKRWFWKIVKDMSLAERQQLLYFATGSSTLPPLDHNAERTRDRISITVDIQHDSRNALPMASTCGQRISIPLYRSYSMLKSKLTMALQCLSYGLG